MYMLCCFDVEMYISNCNYKGTDLVCDIMLQFLNFKYALKLSVL